MDFVKQRCRTSWPNYLLPVPFTRANLHLKNETRALLTPMKCPNVLYTSLLATILVIPFLIRVGFPEPYPAVLLPSGAGRANATGKQIESDRTAIYAKSAGHDAWIRLSPAEILHPVPIQYFSTLAQRYFGLIPTPHQILKLGFLVIDTQPKITDEEVRNAKQWLRQRLTETGYDDSVLRVTQETVTFRRSDGAEMATRYEDDKILDLR
jgi:hypothetical protein